MNRGRAESASVGRRSREIERGRTTEPSLTVADVNTTIDALLATTGPGSVAARRALLDYAFERATPAEADFLVGLFTGGLRQGALAGVMADAIARASGCRAPEVRRAAMLGGDLGITAELALTGGADALAAVQLEVLRPVQPMLAASSPDIEDALQETGVASVEWKLDGARIQVHKRDDDVRVFTRNLNDVTDRLPEVVALARSFSPRALVLDGETIGIAADEQPARVPGHDEPVRSRRGHS